jgi:hypothetical protein
MFAARKTDGAVATTANYIEDVFSTHLYTGTDLTQSRRITNDIALGTGVSFVVYENAYGGGLNGSFVAQTGDVIILYALHSSGTTVSFTLNGSSKTAKTTRTDGNGYWHGVYIEDLTSGNNTFTSGAVSLGFTSAVVIRGASSVSVATNLADAGSTDSFTTTSFSTTGFGLFLISDRDPNATPTIAGSSRAFDAEYTYFRSRFLAVSGNGTTVASQTCTGMVAAEQGSYCGIKIEGMGATVPVTTGSGGMVWLKGRSGATDHALYDTTRGATFDLVSNSTAAQTTQTTGLTSFNGNGFSIGALAKLNTNAATYTSWTFREQAKFFDVLTYTGNNASNRAISHNLGSTPGFILVKATSTTGDWYALHRVGNSGSWGVGTLNSTGTFSAPSPSFWGNGTTFTAPTSTTFTVSADGGSLTNGSGITFVAYLFAHDAGGFGAAGTDNVISCGSFNGDASGTVTVNLGYEPQLVLIKRVTSSEGWRFIDIMRGWVDQGSDVKDLDLFPNSSAAESGNNSGNPTATGFNYFLSNTATQYIYIAIRRGPMKTPTSGTSVYNAKTYSGTNTTNSQTGIGFPPDITIFKGLNGVVAPTWTDRLRGEEPYILSHATSAEASATLVGRMDMDGFTTSSSYSLTNQSGINYIGYCFRRAPGFFDEVCYTGTGSNTTFTHNLGVVPEMMIVKRRDTSGGWRVYVTAIGNTGGLRLNTTDSTITSSTFWNNTTPTASVFTVGTNADVNANGGTYVAYLFASVTGVSKVGSYTGNGSNQTINCGFTAGARFILIKRYDSTGDWYVWDTVRGIVSGNDPHLSLNDTAAEVTTDDSIDPDNSGFIVNQLSATNINVNAATYIYLAIA